MIEHTPVETFRAPLGTYYAKREDMACWKGTGEPAGAKVRQFMRMAKEMPGAPMLVGCSAHSAMQVYVAAAARAAGVKGIIYTAARKERTASTQYAILCGAEVNEVRPAYLSYCRSRARQRAKELGQVVRWDAAAAIEDTAEQVKNLPKDVQTVVVPTGSGLVVAGILVGLARTKRLKVSVRAVAVSNMATVDGILKAARMRTQYAGKFPELTLVRHKLPYEQWKAARLPDGTVLDPYYAAKALEYVHPGQAQCLWVPGVRPLAAMPDACLQALNEFAQEAP